MAAQAAAGLKIESLIEGTGLLHLRDTLANEDVATWAEISRVQLLAKLKENGVARLVERQALANAFGRYQRGEAPNWKAPPSSAPSKPEHAQGPWGTALPERASAPAPVPKRGKPLFDSQTYGADAAKGQPAIEPAPSPAMRTRVRQMLLSAEAEYEERGGLVRLKAAAPVTHWTEAFGECGDRGCGCYRLREPRVRRRFRNLVVNRTVEQLSKVAATESATGDDTTGAGTPAEDGQGASAAARPGVRYVSVGCGSLLTDFEILCGLQEKGLDIEHIALADSEYRGRSHEIFRCLASFFAPARVVAFDSMGDLRHAARDEPEAFGHATTFCKIDASGIGDITAKACAARMLVPGGHAFVVNNDGRCKAGRHCWRRSDLPALDEASAGSNDPAWAGRMDTATIDDEEGRRDPLGGVEPTESWERPLWDGAESDSGPMGQPSHWQNQKKEATLSDDALQAALNLL